MKDAFAIVVEALLRAGVRFVVTGVWGANYYTGGTLFVTQDQDLFLPESPANLLLAWQVCERAGLHLRANDEPLDTPRDLELANAVVRQKALTTATDGDLLQLDLSMVMTGLAFDDVWARRHAFRVGGVTVPVAALADIVAAKRAANRPKDRLFLATHGPEIRRLLQRPGGDGG
jgi:hypothetical protein